MSAAKPQGAESVPETAGETSQAGGPSRRICEDLKEALVATEMDGINEVEQLDDEIANMSKELFDLYGRVSTSCPICLSPWGSDGSHRVITMRCGHVFVGNPECLQRIGRCLICGKRARPNDVRNVYNGQAN